MRNGKAVLQAMRTAGVLRHVAADGADRLRRRIGRVEISLRGNTLRYVRINDSGLDDDAAGWQGPPSRMRFMRARLITMPPAAGSAPPLRPVPAPRLTKGILSWAHKADHCLHLLGSARQHHGFRHHAEIRQPVAFVCLQLALPDDQPVLTNGGAQPGDLARGQHSRNSLREGCESWPANLSRLRSSWRGAGRNSSAMVVGA